MTLITSPDNPLVKIVKSLQRRKARTELGLFIVEGLRGVREAVYSPAEVETVLYSPEMLAPSDVLALRQELVGKQISCREVTGRKFLELAETETPQGVLAVVRQRSQSLDSLLQVPHDLLLVVDGVQDPGNLGTMIRTALAAGVRGMILTKGTTDPYSSKVVRATMGGICHLPVVLNVDPALAANSLKRIKYRVFVADVRGRLAFYQADFRGPSAIVLGNENRGPSAEIALGAESLHIPLLGPAESLNVAVAAGIMLYEVVRQRSK